ncbi:hypothetical protein C8J57DRAFT_436933 [Mycena rebaudengoi]|nr:hypothetical protein C8J57DRAFT_436933 [Mycena rebaudengoi]
METPFANILHTNVIPSDSECQSICDLIKGAREEAARLAQQISEMQVVLDGLVKKRDQMNEFIDAHLALVSPVRRLPDDIVGAIILACLPPTRNPIISGHEAPLLLCRISRTWRNVALSTPRLWASLHIAVPFETTRVQQLENVVSTWISRSGSVPLSVSLVSVSSSPDGLTSALLNSTTLLQTLIRVSHRWRHLRLSFPSSDYFTPFATVRTDDVPILQTVVINGFQGSNWNSLAFIGSTKLHSVSLGDTSRVLDAPVYWGSLRHLALGGRSSYPQHFLTPEAALDVLRQCPSLETCAIPVSAHSSIFTTPPPAPLHMQHMKQLCVLEDSPEVASNLFGSLVLPSLRTLEYSTFHHFGLQPFISLVSSCNHLKHLSLCIQVLTETDLISILRLAPALETFYLFGEPISNGAFEDDDGGFLSLLARPDLPLCPRLHSLKLSDFYSLSDETLGNFISRMNGRLTSVTVTFIRRRQVDIGPSLRDLISSGLHASLHYQPDGPSYSFSPEEGNEDYGAAWGITSISWDPRLEP